MTSSRPRRDKGLLPVVPTTFTESGWLDLPRQLLPRQLRRGLLETARRPDPTRRRRRR